MANIHSVQEPQRVLVVEDNFLIALEIESLLAESGILVVGPAYNLAEGMRLSDAPLDGAILDFRLSATETTEPIVRALTARAVPVVIYSGLGDSVLQLAFPSEVSIVDKAQPARVAVDHLISRWN